MSPWDRPGAGLNWISIELVLVEQTSPSMDGLVLFTEEVGFEPTVHQ